MMKKINRKLIQFSEWTVKICSNPLSFVFSIIFILLWAVTGPMFKFSTDWQLFINTGTTIVSFLLSFLILVAQLVFTRSLIIKVDEIIRVLEKEGARSKILEAEKMSDDEMIILEKEFEIEAANEYII